MELDLPESEIASTIHRNGSTKRYKSSGSLPLKWSPDVLSKEQLVKLMDTSRHIHQRILPKETMHAIITEATKLLNCERCQLYVYDKEMNVLTSVEKEKPFLRVTPGKGFVGTVFATENLMRVDCGSSVPCLSDAVDSDERLHFFKSMLACPIFDADNTATGVMLALNKLTPPGPNCYRKGSELIVGSFADEDETIMIHFACLAGGALRNAAVYNEAVASRDRADGLLTLLQSLRKDLGIQSALFTLTSHAKQLVRAEHCTVYLVDFAHSYLWSLATDTGAEIRMPLNEGSAGRCATTGQVVTCDASEDVQSASDGVTVNKFREVYIPILEEQERVVIAVVHVVNKTDDFGESYRFTDKDIRILEAFGRAVGPKLGASEFAMSATREISTEAGLAFSKSPKEQRKRAAMRSVISEQEIIPEGVSEDDEDDK